jgi:hypothetical protein
MYIFFATKGLAKNKGFLLMEILFNLVMHLPAHDAGHL